jgi:hypothetical protein
MGAEKLNNEIQQETPLSELKRNNVKRKLNINTIIPIFKRKNGVLLESPTKVLF